MSTDRNNNNQESASKTIESPHGNRDTSLTINDINIKKIDVSKVTTTN